jgi:hypothetical protein
MENLSMNHAQQKTVVPSSHDEEEETAGDPSQGRKVVAYALAPAHKAEFVSFYEKTIMPWLKERNVKARSWIAGNYLFALVTANNPPWFGNRGIPGLEHYTVGEYQEPQKLPDLE